MNNIRYPILMINAIGRNMKIKMMENTYRTKPSINNPIPSPTFPTYIWPIPGKANIPPMNAISAAVPGFLYGNCSIIDFVASRCLNSSWSGEWHFGQCWLLILVPNLSPQLLQKFGLALILHYYMWDIYKDQWQY